MANVTGFLLRTSLSDTGALPRSGTWTGCPDIANAGITALSQNTLTQNYGQVWNNLLQGQTNNIYVRAKNLSSAPLTQKAFLFQVPGNLVLRPELWYTKANLVHFVPPNGDPADPATWVDSQDITAGPGEVTATGAFAWTPQTTEHHCMVAVIADSWDSVLADYPTGGSMDAMAQWVYSHGNLGWQNVNIQPITSNIYEASTGFSNSEQKDENVTFTMVASNVPVGARISFSANTSTKSGQAIGMDWTSVPAPPGGGSINPAFEIGSTVTVNAGYETIITYRTDFAGRTPPRNFSMSIQATMLIGKPQPRNALMSSSIADDTLAESYARSHRPDALWRGHDGEAFGVGREGYVRMMSATTGLQASAGGGDQDLGDTAVVVIGSSTTRPPS
jgi:hypothetical protein